MIVLASHRMDFCTHELLYTPFALHHGQPGQYPPPPTLQPKHEMAPPPPVLIASPTMAAAPSPSTRPDATMMSQMFLRWLGVEEEDADECRREK